MSIKKKFIGSGKIIHSAKKAFAILYLRFTNATVGSRAFQLTNHYTQPFMFESCLAKQEKIKTLFSSCATEELKYQKIIEMGRQLPVLPESDKTPENLVQGCQSNMYLRSRLHQGAVLFEGSSDALISAGLAAILIDVYSGETPETILKCPPSYLEELGISASLTPNRANGLYSIHLRMKQDALKFYMQQQTKPLE